MNNNIRSSTRKLNPLLKGIVGKKVDIALRNLTFSDKRISHDIKKTISSAVANAENNFHLKIKKLLKNCNNLRPYIQLLHQYSTQRINTHQLKY